MFEKIRMKVCYFFYVPEYCEILSNYSEEICHYILTAKNSETGAIAYWS